MRKLPLGIGRTRSAGLALAALAVLAVPSFAPAPALAEDAAKPAMIDVEAALSERAIGNPDAPVTIEEYASMTCPHCAAFEEETFGELKKRYIDTGKVRFIFNNFLLNAIDLRASMLARCALAESFFSLTALLFKTQAVWVRASDPVAELGKIGRLAGVDEEKFKACMASEPLANGLIALRKKGTDKGVDSTPTFFINGEKVVGGHSIDEMASLIEPLLK